VKKLAVALALIALIALYALPVTAQEDEPPSWQELYWQVYWEALGEQLTRPRYHFWDDARVHLMDLNNNGALDLVANVFDHDEWNSHAGIALIATIEGGQVRTFTSVKDWDGTYACRATGELRFFQHWGGYSDHRLEVLFDWDNFTMAARTLYFADFVFRAYYLGPRDNNQRVNYRTIQRLNAQMNREFAALRELAPWWEGAVIYGDTYELIRAQFFEAIEELSGGSLYVEPVPGRYPATEFMQIHVPWAPLRWLGIFLENYEMEIGLTIIGLVWAATVVTPALLVRRKYKRKLEEAKP